MHGHRPRRHPDAQRAPAARALYCLGQLLPPLAIARGIATAIVLQIEGALKQNVPKTVARLTGGEYFTLSNTRNLERDLTLIGNHIPNRYILSFQPQSPTPGPHILSLTLPNHITLKVTARSTYWAEPLAARP